jgi:hypothetical protein
MPQKSAETGLAIAPEDLGAQFLRDATEQGTSEASIDLDLRGEAGLPSSIVDELVISELVIEDDVLGGDELALDSERLLDDEAILADDDDPLGILESELAARDAAEDEMDESEADGVDLHSASIRDASLFNRPIADDEAEDEEELLDENATYEPRVQADDVSAPNTERERQIQRRRDELLAQRLRNEKPAPPR